MKTIDLSGLTVEDLKRVTNALNSANVTYGEYDRDLLIQYWSLGFNTFLGANFYAEDQTVSIRLESNTVKSHSIECPLKETPLLLSEIPLDKSFLDIRGNKWVLDTVQEGLPDLQAYYHRVLNALKAPSKEDFYDDASDYQDDEPTDFGDASNYDENLVKRIKKVIG